MERFADPESYELVGAIDPFYERAPRADKLRAAGVPLYRELDEFYAADSCELLLIASPIHLHKAAVPDRLCTRLQRAVREAARSHPAGCPRDRCGSPKSRCQSWVSASRCRSASPFRSSKRHPERTARQAAHAEILRFVAAL